jgi:hypothetical protein
MSEKDVDIKVYIMFITLLFAITRFKERPINSQQQKHKYNWIQASQ